MPCSWAEWLLVRIWPLPYWFVPGGRGRWYVGGSRSGREDPEWFTDGPASQADKLELWDFDQGHGSRNFPKDVRGIDASKVKLAAKQSMEADGAETVAKEQGRNEIVDVCSGEHYLPSAELLRLCVKIFAVKFYIIKIKRLCGRLHFSLFDIDDSVNHLTLEPPDSL